MDLEQKAIERLKMASETSLTHYKQPLMITYSGGKDSDTVLRLAQRAGIPMEVVHNHTTADAPETVQYVKRRLHELELQGVKVSITYPTYQGSRVSLWTLIPMKLMPPTRKVRYCCEVCKEQSGTNRAIATGVRWAESSSRSDRGAIEAIGATKKNRISIMPEPEAEQLALSEVLILGNDNDDRRRWLERCQMRGKVVCNPIIEWSDRDVWGFLSDCREEINPCYHRYGLTRVGCIGCPMAGNGRYREFEIWPQYKQLYLHAFGRLIKELQARGKKTGKWKTPGDVMAWWMEENPDQTMLDGFEDQDYGEG